MSRPPYRVPLVSETAQAPRNGLRVVSTFSGGGGSCYGYELAGYEVIWANEMVQSSRDTYQANHPNTILDPRDIRQVRSEDVLKATGLGVGELDLFDGSPPCQAFSTAGIRANSWGKSIKHKDGSEQVSNDLFFEYARLLEGLQPKTFIAENVKGLAIGVSKGYFKRILAQLKAAGYLVQVRLLDASWLGVPQARQRLIFIGVRKDLGLAPTFPSPLPYQYTLRDALSGLPENLQVIEPKAWITGKQAALVAELRPGQDGSTTTIGKGGWWSSRRMRWDIPAFTVLASNGERSCSSIHPEQDRRLSIAELRRVCGFPDDYVLTGNYVEQWARLGNAVPPPMAAAVASALRDKVLQVRGGS